MAEPINVSDETTRRRGKNGGYLPLYPIAKGGIGVVQLVLKREGSFERLYAMKTLREHLREEKTFRDSFLQEARIAGLLRHSNVVSVTDVGEGRDGPYFVMDYIEGITLAQLLRGLPRGELLSIQLCLRIAQQVARGLHAAHELTTHDGKPLQLVHRDVSPQNVLIGFDGVVRVADFGIAKALGRDNQTTTGILKGKLGYMAPEQLRFERPDRRTDLYSLGVVLFELLAGRRLYSGGAESEAPHLILHGPTPDISEERRDVPDSLVALLFDLLAKDRDHRPLDAREVADCIGDILEEMGEPPESIESFLEERFGGLRDQMRAKTALALSAVQEGRDPTAAVAHADREEGAPGTPPVSVRYRRRARGGVVLLALATLAAATMGVWYAVRGSESASGDEETVVEEGTTEAALVERAESEPTPESESAADLASASESESAPASAPEPESAPESESASEPDETRQARRRGRRASPRRGPPSSSMMDCPPGWWCPP